MTAFPLRDINVTKKKNSSCVKSFQKAWWWMLSVLGGLFPLQQLHLMSLLLIKYNIDVGAVLESQTFLCSSSKISAIQLRYMVIGIQRSSGFSQSGSLYLIKKKVGGSFH